MQLNKELVNKCNALKEEKTKLKNDYLKLKQESGGDDSSVSSHKIINSLNDKETDREIEELKKDHLTQVNLLTNKIELLKSREGKMKKQILELSNQLDAQKNQKK